MKRRALGQLTLFFLFLCTHDVRHAIAVVVKEEMASGQKLPTRRSIDAQRQVVLESINFQLIELGLLV